MKRSDKERLKKIVATWESLKAEMHKRGITPELLLEALNIVFQHRLNWVSSSLKKPR